jgi:uncharacterized protein YaaW (UPF0174 family)
MDKDLLFLKNFSDDELKPIVDLMRDKLTSTLSPEAIVHPSMNVEEVVKEILLFGGNTITNPFTGGVPYRQMLCDVCDKMKVEHRDGDYIESIEERLILKVMDEWFKKSSDEEKAKLFGEMMDNMPQKEKEEFIEAITNDPNWKSRIAASSALSGSVIIKLLVKHYGIKVFYGANRAIMTIVGLIGREWLPKGLLRWMLFGGSQAIIKTVTNFVLPILNVLLIAWMILDIASPAYRITVPVTINIALLRLTSRDLSNQNDIKA